ncbi:MAG: hypothetical protein ABI693_16675 [Bryobacteraceae bacterium]
MRILTPILCFAAAMAGLLWQYPWSVEYGMFHFSSLETLWAYALTATVMTLIASCVRVLVRRIVPESRRLASVTLGAVVTFVGLLLLAFTFGPLGANLPGTRVRGIFFAEWSFVLFILLSIPFAVVAMLLLNLPRRPRERMEANPSA